MSANKEPQYNNYDNMQCQPTAPFEPAPGEPVNPDEPKEPREPEKDAESLDSQTRQIMETGSVTMTKGRHLIHCLTIIGQIEGHFMSPPNTKTTKYEHVIPQIVAVEEDPSIEGLLIILNTVGGDVEAGLAIAELLAGMKKPTVSLVLGGGHSIGVPLAVSAKKSFIAETATMTIHPVRMNGVVLGVPQTLGYFYRMQDRITKFVCDNSSISPERFKELMMNTSELVMDIGSVLDGKDAVKEGLIDQIGGLSDAISALYSMIEEKAANEGNGESDVKYDTGTKTYIEVRSGDGNNANSESNQKLERRPSKKSESAASTNNNEKKSPKNARHSSAGDRHK